MSEVKRIWVKIPKKADIGHYNLSVGYGINVHDRKTVYVNIFGFKTNIVRHDQVEVDLHSYGEEFTKEIVNLYSREKNEGNQVKEPY